jgi:hypothetical protein
MTIASSGEEQRKMGTFYCVYFGLFKNILVGPGPHDPAQVGRCVDTQKEVD